MRQDYLYLAEFSRVFAWAAARADRLEAMGWYAAALHLTLNTEMGLHREYAARFGIAAFRSWRRETDVADDEGLHGLPGPDGG